ncbi:MAG: hypothetical protein WCF85_01005 [Rhodospirillaceae bacterium]
MPNVRILLLILALLAAPLTEAFARTGMAQRTELADAGDGFSTGGGASFMTRFVVVIGCAWVGSILARRLINSWWFGYIGARAGAMLGLDALAALGLFGESAAPAAAALAL